MMLWKKPNGLRYVDLAIYVDEHMTDIAEPGKYPEVENTVYNYLWLLVKALAIKKGMFENFEDYDPFAFHAANRLFFALRKNQWNQGKVIKGKEIRPIKSCLNYMKKLMYPMKVEFQNETFREVMSEAYTSKKFDSYAFTESLKNQIIFTESAITDLIKQLKFTINGCGKLIDKILNKSPFGANTVEYRRIKISLLLNCYFTLQAGKKLNVEPAAVVLWKLPKSMGSYVRILLREFYTELKTEIIGDYQEAFPNISDTELKNMLPTPTEDNHED